MNDRQIDQALVERVIAMFRQFATVNIKLFFNSEEHPYNAQ